MHLTVSPAKGRGKLSAMAVGGVSLSLAAVFGLTLLQILWSLLFFVFFFRSALLPLAGTPTSNAANDVAPWGRAQGWERLFVFHLLLVWGGVSSIS